MKFQTSGIAVIAVGFGLAVAGFEASAQPPATAPAAPAAAAPPLAPVQASMRQMGGAQRALGAELAKEGPDPAALKAAAARLDTLAGQLPGWFAAPVTGAPTAGKPEIWSDASGFAAAAKALHDQTGKLVGASEAGDVAALKAQAGALGGACKSCHDAYRAPAKT